MFERPLRWLQRRHAPRYDVACSLIDQGLLSGSAFVVTVALANVLDATEFGKFSVAWAFSVLFESAIFKGLLDDSLPSTAVVLPRARRRQLRGSLLLLSLGLSGLFGLVLIVLGALVSTTGQGDGSLWMVTGVTIVAIRSQNGLRRILYFDRRLRLILAAATLYTAVLLSSLLAVSWPA